MIDVGALYQRHGAMVLRRARSILGHEELCRDVVHDVFLAMHERRSSLQEHGLVSWLYIATTHRCLKVLRSATTRKHLLLQHGDVLTPTAPEGAMSKRLVQQVLHALSDELAQVAVYRHVDELTHAEIADLMGCSRRHVGNLIAELDKAAARLQRRAS